MSSLAFYLQGSLKRHVTIIIPIIKMGKLRLRNVAAQGLAGRVRIHTQTFQSCDLYAKSLVDGGRKTGKYKEP